MADNAYHVEVVAADRELYSGMATFVIAQTTVGELGVLANHEPLLGELVEGGIVVIVEETGDRKALAVQGGFLSVTGDSLTVLAEAAQWADEIDLDAEKIALETSEENSSEHLVAQARIRAVEAAAGK